MLLNMLFFSSLSFVVQACMGMLRLVRAFTGREKILKFDGCYHGHADGFLVQAGSGVATLGLPDSPGEIWRRGLSSNACMYAIYHSDALYTRVPLLCL